jgi:hypothetical protein
MTRKVIDVKCWVINIFVTDEKVVDGKICWVVKLVGVTIEMEPFVH